MGIFDGISNARIGKGGLYFMDEASEVKNARYVVDVQRVYTQNNRAGVGMFVIEGAIVWSDNPERTPGMVPSQVIMMSWDGALGMIKGFLAACNGADPSNEHAVKAVFTDDGGNDITEIAAEYAVGPDNPLAGTRVELQCSIRPKKKSAGNFTHHNWKPYDADAFTASLQTAQA